MRTTTRSLMVGIVVSLLIGAAFAVPTYEATSWMWQPLELALTVLVGGWVAKSLFVKGYQSISIPVNHVGVATRFGDKPIGWLYDAGDHWGFPGISGAIPVDMRHRRIDLREKFSASAGDTSDVGIDGFLLVRTVEPSWTIDVEDLDESIRELFESRTRFFTSMISKAESAVKFRDLLANYLELEPRDTDALTPEHQAFKDRLTALPMGYLVKDETKDAIEALMAKDEAGALKRLARKWGDQIEEVEIEQVDIPQAVKDANIRKATQAALMDAEKTRNTARKTMVEELVAAGVNANTAMNSVDMLLNLGVKKEVKEITITDLEKVSSTFGGQIAGVLERWLANRKDSSSERKTS